MPNWTLANIPPQRGRTSIVTGTGGIGLETAIALSRAQATVIIAGRNPVKGQAALDTLRRQVPSAVARFELLDLADLRSIRHFAERAGRHLDGLDMLINNAAVMAPPTRQSTVDGFELQFGTNYLGHFALTAAVLPLLRAREGSRVVSLSSVAARSGRIAIDDLQSTRAYVPMDAYAQSKLACLMFAFEMQRQSTKRQWGVTSIAAHPGISRTELIPNGYGRNSLQGRIRRFMPFLFQPAAQGALPSLYAATAREARGGMYYGPHRFSEVRGYPRAAQVPTQANDEQVAAALWTHSTVMTGGGFG